MGPELSHIWSSYRALVIIVYIVVHAWFASLFRRCRLPIAVRRCFIGLWRRIVRRPYAHWPGLHHYIERCDKKQSIHARADCQASHRLWCSDIYKRSTPSATGDHRTKMRCAWLKHSKPPRNSPKLEVCQLAFGDQLLGSSYSPLRTTGTLSRVYLRLQSCTIGKQIRN